jgi:hypothetical protein
MQKSSAGGSNFDDDPGDRERVVGDADGVQKTSYVVGQGTDPGAPGPDAGRLHAGARRGEGDAYAATVRTGGGLNLGLWVAVVLAVAIALIYGIGLFT